MKLTDIIALAKQGYKPADIKELLTMADQEPTPAPAAPAPADNGAEEDPPKDQPKPTQAHATTTEAPADGAAEDGKDTEPDYKALYEAEKKKRQEENRRRAADPAEPFDEKKFLQDIASMY